MNLMDFMTLDDLLNLTYTCAAAEMMVLRYLLEWDGKELVPKRLLYLMNYSIDYDKITVSNDRSVNIAEAVLNCCLPTVTLKVIDDIIKFMGRWIHYQYKEFKETDASDSEDDLNYDDVRYQSAAHQRFSEFEYSVVHHCYSMIDTATGIPFFRNQTNYLSIHDTAMNETSFGTDICHVITQHIQCPMSKDVEAKKWQETYVSKHLEKECLCKTQRYQNIGTLFQHSSNKLGCQKFMGTLHHFKKDLELPVSMVELETNDQEDVHLIVWYLCKRFMWHAFKVGSIVKDAHEKYHKFEPRESILEHNIPKSVVFYKYKEMNIEEASLWNTLHLIPGNIERSMHKAQILFQNIVPKVNSKKATHDLQNSEEGQYQNQYNELIQFFHSRVKNYNKMFNCSMDTSSSPLTRSRSSIARSLMSKESDEIIHNTYSVRR